MSKVKISLIVAIGEDFEIGADNQLLWHIKDDLKLFMKATAQHVVIHGRKSFESIGSPLKNRSNIIITRDQAYDYPSCFIAHSLPQAIELAKSLEQKGEIFILGGAEIYTQSLDIIETMYISHVQGKFPNADAYFPTVNFDDWNCLRTEKYSKNDENEFGFEFKLYERKLKK